MKLRCPLCLAHDNDVVLLPRDDGSWECPHCPYRGTEDDVQERYVQHRSRLRRVADRLTLEDLRRL